MMEEIKDMQKEQRENMKQINKLKEKNETLETELKETNKKIKRIERYNKRKHLVSTELPIEDSEHRTLKEELKLLINNILKNKNKLREIKEHRIYTDFDMTNKKREIQKEIRLIVKKEKDNELLEERKEESSRIKETKQEPDQNEENGKAITREELEESLKITGKMLKYTYKRRWER
ncbi:hypothetical protein ILUMI_12752 [Ignelater luminosus]|uniref:Uncharacterized protein n=1 Tax=Ignelater luminosus TaxID=2038154 RepID=A0A8K0CXJ7_IGNLU|nr:hypothetical protein ILUMI_12752 [Ignelater luminosus]